MIYKIDDILVTKKSHVCGSNEWRVIRLGADVKIKCEKCGREIMVFKAELDKKIKNIKTKENI